MIDQGPGQASPAPPEDSVGKHRPDPARRVRARTENLNSASCYLCLPLIYVFLQEEKYMCMIMFKGYRDNQIKKK